MREQHATFRDQQRWSIKQRREKQETNENHREEGAMKSSECRERAGRTCPTRIVKFHNQAGARRVQLRRGKEEV